ncbi:MAG: substrate-binding domain-containing protein [Ilumatobacteraceae bacterium]
MKKKFITSVAIALVGALGAGTAALAESANGSGATFPQNFQAAATVAYNAATGHNVSYANPGGGSGKGKRDFKAGLTDFGGSDSAVATKDEASFDWVYVPYVGGAIAVAYRLDELKGATLSLSEGTINGIFGGVITKWNDPAIVADMKKSPTWANSKKKSDLKGATALIATTGRTSVNITVSAVPSVLRSYKGKTIEIIDQTTKKTVKKGALSRGEVTLSATGNAKSKLSVKLGGKEIAVFQEAKVTMPSKDITVVYRSDGSGTTNNFCNFMKNAANSDWAVNDAFTSCVPGGSAKVATFGSRFQGQSGSANVSNYIADNSGTIGYTEVSFVTDATRAAKGMKAANVRNAAGRYMAPTSAAASAFLSGSRVDTKGFVTFDYAQKRNTSAYPIVAVTYVLGKTAKSSKNAVVSDYLQWILNTFAPTNAEALGYAPLSGALKDKALVQAKLINSK